MNEPIYPHPTTMLILSLLLFFLFMCLLYLNYDAMDSCTVEKKQIEEYNRFIGKCCIDRCNIGATPEETLIYYDGIAPASNFSFIYFRINFTEMEWKVLR